MNGNITIKILYTYDKYYLSFALGEIFYKRKNKVVIMMNNELLKNLFITCNHSKGTQKAYNYALKVYCPYFQMEIRDLLMEAENEESKGIKWKHSKLKSRLLEFRHFLLGKYSLNTVKSIMINVI